MNKKILRVLFVLLFTIFAFVFYYSGASKYLTSENILTVKKALIDNYGLTIPIIIILFFYIIFNIFGFPTMYFSILLGYIYGMTLGLLIAFSGMITGIASSFIISRYLFRDLFLKKFGEKEIFIKLETQLKERYLLTPIFTRLIFIIPYNVQNYLYGLTNIKISIYLAGTSIGIIPITILNVLIGQIISEGKILNKSITNLLGVLSILLCGALVFFLIFKVLKIKKNKKELQ